MSDDRVPFYEQPTSALSDRELRAALYVAAERRDEVAQSDPAVAASLGALAEVLAAERDSRRALARAVDDALYGPSLMLLGDWDDDLPPAA